MKPVKNRFFCKDCGKIKMLFETEKKAENFIKFNSEKIEEESGFKPERTYFCIACNGWHVTHTKENLNTKSKTEKLLDFYNYEIEQKALRKTQQQAFRKEQKALELAQKKEQETQEHAQKIEDLEKSLNKVEKYIARLEKPKDSKAKCIEMLNEAFVELENVKSTRIVFKKSEQRIKIAEEKLNYLQKKIEQIIVIYPHRKNELEYTSEQLECQALLLAKKKEEALIHTQKVEDLKKCLNRLEKCIEILDNLDNLKYSEEYKNKYIEIFNEAFIELEKAKSTDVVFKKSRQRIQIAKAKFIILSSKYKQ